MCQAVFVAFISGCLWQFFSTIEWTVGHHLKLEVQLGKGLGGGGAFLAGTKHLNLRLHTIAAGGSRQDSHHSSTAARSSDSTAKSTLLCVKGVVVAVQTKQQGKGGTCCTY